MMLVRRAIVTVAVTWLAPVLAGVVLACTSGDGFLALAPGGLWTRPEPSPAWVYVVQGVAIPLGLAAVPIGGAHSIWLAVTLAESRPDLRALAMVTAALGSTPMLAAGVLALALGC
jgi:hypothetical protein